MQDRYRLSNLIEKNLKDKKQYIYRIVDTNTSHIIATATSTKSKRQALTKAQDKLNNLNQELDNTTKLKTLENLIIYFLKNFKNTSKRQSTYRSREKQCHQLLEILGKNTALTDIKPTTLEANKELLEKHVICLKMAYKLAIRDRLLQFDPTNTVQVKKKNYSRDTKGTYTEEQIETLLSHLIKKHNETTQPTKKKLVFRDIVFICTSLCTGMRQAEILGMQQGEWQTTGFYEVKQQLVKYNKNYVIDGEQITPINNSIALSTPKTINSIREVYIPEPIRNLYKDLLPSSKGFIFATVKCPYTSHSGLQNIWSNIMKDETLEIPHYSLHSLRGTFTTLALAEYNQNLYTTQKVLGHSTNRSIGATSYYIQIKQTQIKQLCQYMYDQLCKKPLQLLE